MDSELAKVVSDILNRLSSAYDEYREDYPLKGKVKFSDFIESNERTTTQAIEEYIKYYGISDAVVKFLITKLAIFMPKKLTLVNFYRQFQQFSQKTKAQNRF